MDKNIPRAICFNKDDGETGEDEIEHHYNILHPTAGDTSGRLRAAGEPDCQESIGAPVIPDV